MAKTQPTKADTTESSAEKKGGIPLVCPKCGGTNVYVETTKTRRYPTFLKRTRYCFCNVPKCLYTFPLATVITESPAKE